MQNSPYTENELLEIASRFNKHLKTQFPAIRSDCPDLDPNLVYKFKALYYDIRTHATEYEKEEVMQSFELDLSGYADKVRMLFPVFRFYIQKAFPYDTGLWEDYGYCEIEKVARDYSSLQKCLEGSVRLINDKRSELKAVNCSETTLREIEQLAKQISDRHQELIDYREKNEEKIRSFKKRINDLFQLMVVVDQAASKCLDKNPDALKYLTLPPTEQIH